MCRLHRRPRFVEDRHQAIADPLDDVAAMTADAGFLGDTDLPQQLQRRLVARGERPRREVDEIGEKNRHLAITAPAPLSLGHCLPDLERAEAELTGSARALRRRLGDPAGEQVRGPIPRRRQRIAELAVPGEQVAQQLCDPVHARRPVDLARLRDARAQAIGVLVLIAGA